MKGELLKKICWPPLRSDGSINISSVLEFQEWAVKNDLLDRAVGEDELWDPRFVDYANDVLGKADP
jgi:hypothetical protein